jgi:major vault protein
VEKDSSQTILLLTKLQYCHVINNNTGVVRLVEGPHRGSLESNEALYGPIKPKLIVKERQYAVILNPFDAKRGDIRHGDRELRVGPTMFSLFPGEELEADKVNDEYILIRDTGLLVKAVRDFEDGGTARKAGDLWIVPGPSHYIPHKYSMVERFVKAISLGPDEGMYIKNIRTGDVRLEKGPKTFMVLPEEEPFRKEYSDRELAALKLDPAKFDASRAIPLLLNKAEAAMITAGQSQRVEFGPKVILLGPFEKLYIMSISGSTPKKPNVLKIWNVMLGPVFSTDEISVRTKDNAVLLIMLRYKWRFRVEKEHPEKIFAVEDLIGFATETMSGIIREAAAKFNFEDFHPKAADLVKQAVFGIEKDHFVFAENGFEIFGIDIKRIAPEDPTIAAQLNSAIKSNMEVYVNKIHQTAELEAERQLVQGKTEIEKSKSKLIEIEQANESARQLGLARIKADAGIAVAKGDAEAIRIKRAAENAMDLEKMTQSLAILQKDGADAYLRLQQVLSFANVEKTVIVPTDSRLFIPMGDLEKAKKAVDMLPEDDEEA